MTFFKKNNIYTGKKKKRNPISKSPKKPQQKTNLTKVEEKKKNKDLT